MNGYAAAAAGFGLLYVAVYLLAGLHAANRRVQQLVDEEAPRAEQ